MRVKVQVGAVHVEFSTPTFSMSIEDDDSSAVVDALNKNAQDLEQGSAAVQKALDDVQPPTET